MITKRILGEKILRRINGGDYTSTSSNVAPQDVYLEIEAALNSLIQKRLNESQEDISSEFSTTYTDIIVQKDAKRERFYVELPATPISLVIKGNSSNSVGIRQVSGMKDEYKTFIPMNSGDASVFAGLPASNLGGQVGYWQEGSKLVFEGMPYYWEGKGLLIKMISSIYDLDEDDFIPIPAGEELNLEDLVFERMTSMRNTPQSKIADSNPNSK